MNPVTAICLSRIFSGNIVQYYYQEVTLPDAKNYFLPDLCRLPVVLAVLAVTQLLVIIYILSLNEIQAFDWQLLSLLSFYTQWVSMLSVVSLCNLREFINRVSSRWAAVLSLCWLMVVVAFTNTVAQWIYGGNQWKDWSVMWLLKDTLIYMVLAGIALRYFYIQQQWRQGQEATHSARLDALYARIRPHFLFNSMNTIASLIRYAPKEAEEAVEDLSILLRATMADGKQIASWEQELDICHAYCRIEQLRLGDRLSIDWDLDAIPIDFELPPLVLQPLLENAIYHGIEKRPEGGRVNVSSQVERDGDGGTLVILTIINPLVSSSADIGSENSDESDDKSKKHSNVSLKHKTHNGLALDNISARLTTLYREPVSGHSDAKLVHEQVGDTYRAVLTIPLTFDLYD